jgi:uncharacterized cofD-like protein
MYPKIVCLGGGTGLPNLLRGLKLHSDSLTAIVTVADDGGSSGIIRNELKIPPPGDIRNCLLALAYTEPFMEKLFQYRFNSGSFKGHSFGNLFLAAMTEMLGNFELAIKESSKVLAVRGTVLPSTLEDVTLEAVYDDGEKACGESYIPNSRKRISRVMLKPSDAKPLGEALEAIEKADAIILGPGSLYTSLIPNLLVKDLTCAISKAKAKKIYVVNVMTQPGETEGYSASDHVKAVVNHSSRDVMEYVIINSGQIPEYLLSRYLSDGSTPVECDSEAIERMGYTVVTGSVINPTDVVRHSSRMLAETIMALI